MQRLRHAIVIALVLVFLGGCVPAPASPAGRAATETRTGRSTHPLVIAVKLEPPTLATRVLGQPGTGLDAFRALFNAFIARRDDKGALQPYLVEAVPVLHTDTWRVFPDGRMETTYRLRPNLVWHDGTPLTAQDFTFGWRVYTDPPHGIGGSPPFHAIDEVVPEDERTFLIRWKLPYPAAAELSATFIEFPPLPRHILGQAFEDLPADEFANLGYWTTDYVGLGPYRLDRWEPGSFLEATAFDRYALGRPKIDRVKLVFIGDPNTVVANLLAGEVHVAEGSIAQLHVETLKREWGEAGVVLVLGGSYRLTFFQLRPELANPPAILDVRVRRALAHSVDKKAITEVITPGYDRSADSMIRPRSEFGAAAERGAVKYGYDLRRTEQLMEEAEFRKGPDGFYRSSAQGRFAADLQTTATPYSEPELLIMAAGWRAAGFDIQESVIPAARARDAQLGATFSSMLTRTTFGGEKTMVDFTPQSIPRPENRWRGTNRGGWSNPEYGRLVEAFNRTLDPMERAEQVTRMIRLFTEDLPIISLYFFVTPFPHASILSGPQEVPDETDIMWNVHEWVLR